MTTILDWQRAYFRDQADPKLRHTWPTMAVLMTHANKDLECWPSQAKIAKAAGIKNPDTVRKHLKANLDAGWLLKPHTGGPGDGTSRYRFVLPSPLQRGDIPSTGMGAIPSVEMPKLSSRTGQGTVQVTNQERSPLQGGEAAEGGSPSTEPKSGSGGISSGEHERSEHAGPYPIPTDGSIPSDDEIAEILAEHYAAHETPQQKLLDAIRANGGTVPAKSAAVADAVGQDAGVIIPQMIRDGLIVHDTSGQPATLVLA